MRPVVPQRRATRHLEIALCALSALAVCIASACSGARLYGADGAANSDRLALRGSLCADGSDSAELPLRVVLVADRAAGPLYSSFDTSATWVQSINDYIAGALRFPNVELAVVGFGGRSRKLAPAEGNFTRNPGELAAAVQQLALPDACAGEDQCRTYLDGLRTARALIEDDLRETPSGERVLTQYIVLFVTAGPHQPLALASDCCASDDAACLNGDRSPSPACQLQKDREELARTQDAIARAGGAGLKLHIFHLAAEPDATVNDDLQRGLEQLAFAGRGSYTRFNEANAVTVRSFDVLDTREPLIARALMAVNINARPGPEGPLPDSDADGLADAEERQLGTDPVSLDSDADGVSDFVEVLSNLDPNVAATPDVCRSVSLTADSDLDGLLDCDETLLGTDPLLPDSDGDLLPDWVEVVSRTDYLDDDGQKDSDGDGISNADELRGGTDPRSTDPALHFSMGYRYEVSASGLTSVLTAPALEALTGVDLVLFGDGSTPGLGRLSFDAASGEFRWQDPADSLPGPPVAWRTDAAVRVPAQTRGQQAFVELRVDPALLPPSSTSEAVRLLRVERDCMDFTVRNIALVDTLGDGSLRAQGTNRVVLFFAQSPRERSAALPSFKVAEIPVRRTTSGGRLPSDPVLDISAEEFVDLR